MTREVVQPEWVEVSEFPNYEISKTKGIRRKGKDKTLKGRTWLGYPKVTLMRDGVKHERRIHKLVGEHFIPNPNNLPIVNHIDSDRSNYSVDNLEWVDNSGNQKHRWKTQKEGVIKKKYTKEYGVSRGLRGKSSLDKNAAIITGKTIAEIRRKKALKSRGLSSLEIKRKALDDSYKAAGMGPLRRAINHALPFNKVII